MTAKAVFLPAGAIEQQTIFPIPHDQRHGRARDLFTIWFGANLHLLTVVTGAIATLSLKLPLSYAIIAIVTGNLAGAVFMALHAAQGPRLGVPQMVQSRGQFGSLGSLMIVAVVAVTYLGFVASNFVVAGQSLQRVVPQLGSSSGAVLTALMSVLGVIAGHDLLHRWGRWTSWLSGTAMLLCFAWIIGVHGVPAFVWEQGRFSASGFLGMISIGAVWQIAYAPYVSDYSRYLPADSGARPAFRATYWGCALGSMLPMVLGALVGVMGGGKGAIVELIDLIGPLAIPVVFAFTVGIGAASAMNIYCCVLSVLTGAQTLVASWRPTPATRITLGWVFNGIGLAIALLTSSRFLMSYEHFLIFLLCLMGPWTAINLIDYYILKKGVYDIESFFKPDGGIYGRFNIEVCVCFVLGIVSQLPFMVTPDYTGIMASALGGVDVSWIIGIAVTATAYYGSASFRSANGALGASGFPRRARGQRF